MVRLSFSKADAPERIVFVLKELQPENWINNGSCYSVQVRRRAVHVSSIETAAGEAWLVMDSALSGQVDALCVAAAAQVTALCVHSPGSHRSQFNNFICFV